MFDGSDHLTLPLPELGSAPSLDVAPWHARRPHLLANALTEARRTVPAHLVTLALDLLPRLPRRPVASQSLRAFTINPSSNPLLLDDAIGCPWICPSTEQGWNVLTVDVDHDDADELAYDLERRGLPRPTVVVDPWSGRAHVWAPLATPVSYGKGARPGPQILADLACRLLAAFFRGTPLSRAALVKSPWGLTEALIGEPLRRSLKPTTPGLWEAHQEAKTGLMWNTIPGTGTFELRAIVAALVDYADEMPPSRRGTPFRKRRGDPSYQSRNDYVFDLTRWWAYDRCERDGGAIANEAQRVNATLSDPLPTSEVAGTAKSITKFMNTRFRPAHGAGAGRGRDAEAGAGLAATEKRKLAARITATARADSTTARINAAVEALRVSDRPLTQVAVAQESGISLRTVKRRWKVPNGALSGSAAAAAHPAVSFLQIPSSLVALAGRDRAIRSQVRRLAALAAAARRPGAKPFDLPLYPHDVAVEPAVRAALLEARAAVADARRRAAAREERGVSQARRSEMERRLRLDPGAAWTWWRASLDRLDHEWDAKEALADGAWQLQAVRNRRDHVFSGRWRSWKAAQAAVLGTPRPLADHDIPW